MVPLVTYVLPHLKGWTIRNTGRNTMAALGISLALWAFSPDSWAPVDSGIKPDEITILAYDALGLIHFIWRKNNGINSINDFFIKERIKGKIGTFEFKEKKVTQQLKIYKTDKNKFKEY